MMRYEQVESRERSEYQAITGLERQQVARLAMGKDTLVKITKIRGLCCSWAYLR